MVGQIVSIGGVISKVQKIFTKRQQNMLFVTIEDMDTHMEILVFPKVLETTGPLWTEEKMIIATGRLSDKDGVFKLLAESVKTIDQQEVEKLKRIMATQKKNGNNNSQQKLTISLPAGCSQVAIKQLSQFFDSCDRGAMKVILEINNSKLETPYCIKKLDDIQEKLKEILPEGKIIVL